MSNESPETLFSSFRRFFSGTALSRVSGFFREVAMAAIFGTSPAVAAFWMAFRFSQLFRRIFGEGGLQVAFIPHFESVRKNDPKEAAAFFSRLTLGLSGILLALALIGEMVLGAFLLYANLSEGNGMIIKLTMLMLPSFLFVSLYALNAALMQCEGRFFLPSAAPTLFNLIWVAALFFLPKKEETALLFLAMILVVAFALQWLITFWPVKKILKETLQGERRVLPWRSYLAILRPFSLAIIGVTAVQINSALDALFARFADPEGPAILWYALKLEQLPLALFGIGVTAAFFPSLSRAANGESSSCYLSLLNLAVKKSLSLMIPLTFALFALGLASVNFVYGRGAFTLSAIYETTSALWAYGAGLLPTTLVFIFASAFYAQKEYRHPTILSLTSVLLNGILNAIFVFLFYWGAISIALATSLAATYNAFFLAYFIRRKMGSFSDNLLSVTLRSLFSSALAALATLLLSHFLFHGGEFPLFLGIESALPKTVFAQTLTLGSLSATFLISFLLFSLLFKNRELFELFLPGKKRLLNE